MEDGFYHISLNGVDPPTVKNRRWFKVGFALIGGSCLVIASIVATCVSNPAIQSTKTGEATSLVGLPVLRGPVLQSQAAWSVFPKRQFPGIPKATGGPLGGTEYTTAETPEDTQPAGQSGSFGSVTAVQPDVAMAQGVGRSQLFRYGPIALPLLGLWGLNQAATMNVPADMLGAEEIMDRKAHGTCSLNVPANIRWGCDSKMAARICCFNRAGAEPSGYFLDTKFLSQANPGTSTTEVTFYDTITGKPLFVAPRGRTWNEFVEESKSHGWPSFRDSEVLQENIRVLPGGETVSTDGTHLGHNIPDLSGNRYCINLVSIAGLPPDSKV